MKTAKSEIFNYPLPDGYRFNPSAKSAQEPRLCGGA